MVPLLMPRSTACSTAGGGGHADGSTASPYAPPCSGTHVEGLGEALLLGGALAGQRRHGLRLVHLLLLVEVVKPAARSRRRRRGGARPAHARRSEPLRP